MGDSKFINLLDDKHSFISIPNGIMSGQPSMEITKLNTYIKLESNEKIRLYYKNNDKNIVVLTNKRFIKLEHTIITINIYLTQIVSVSHHKTNILHWDKLVLEVKNPDYTNIVLTVGIDKTKVAKFFIDILTELLKDKVKIEKTTI